MKRLKTKSAVNILEKKPSPFETNSSYTHHSYTECPVCNKRMVQAFIKSEAVLFCPDHRITFPLRSQD